MSSKQSISANRFGTGVGDEIVEIALLVPANRVEALMDLSRRRRQSVAQILRGLIDRALADDD